MNQSTTTLSPRGKIRHSEDGVLLSFDLPGVTEDALSVSIEADTLTLEGTPRTIDTEGLTRVHAEFDTGTFRRSIALPDDIDRDAIEATLEDGVLRIRLSRATPQVRRIPISTN